MVSARFEKSLLFKRDDHEWVATEKPQFLFQLNDDPGRVKACLAEIVSNCPSGYRTGRYLAGVVPRHRYFELL